MTDQTAGPSAAPKPPGGERKGLAPGIALCLSGGGYRAMIFHVGALLRLNELGLLPRLARVCSVSGGSITAGLLGLTWKRLGFDANGVAANLQPEIIAPLRRFAGLRLDIPAAIQGMFRAGAAAEHVAMHYARSLYGNALLDALPADGEGPRFIITATSLQSGALWRFSRPYMGDYKVGLVANPAVRLADAVAASSAFPPFLSPAILQLDPARFTPDERCPLQTEPYTRRVVLSDGGVYDNMGIEPAWKRCATVLVSDAGAKMPAKPKPAANWGLHTLRILNVIDNQVRSLRKRAIVEAFKEPTDAHDGTYWGIGTDIADYQLADAIPCDSRHTRELAAISTRLWPLAPRQQERLINWGYAVADAALRKHAATHIKHPAPPPPVLPYPRTPV